MSEETDVKDFLKSVWEDPITEALLDTFERQVMATGELMDGDVPIVSKADCHLHFPSLIMLRKLRLALEEITRLLAIEVAAKEICADNWSEICDCDPLGFNIRTGVATGHKPDCPVLVINPIGDK